MQIEKFYKLPFGVARVFAAWVSSDTVIAPATRMNVEPRIGGLYQLFMEGGEIEARCEGRFSEFEPGRRVRYSWEWNGDGEVSEITVRFSALGAGCRVDVTHDGFDRPESIAMHDAGWDSYIKGFIAHLSV